jgi:hypothetical protein
MGRSGGKLNCDLPMGKEMVLHSGFGADMVKMRISLDTLMVFACGPGH